MAGVVSLGLWRTHSDPIHNLRRLDDAPLDKFKPGDFEPTPDCIARSDPVYAMLRVITFADPKGGKEAYTLVTLSSSAALTRLDRLAMWVGGCTAAGYRPWTSTTN